MILRPHYHSQGSVSTLPKQIIFFFIKWIHFLFLKLYIYFIIYYNIVVKLFRVKPMIIIMFFNMSTTYFHKISIHYYLMTKLPSGFRVWTIHDNLVLLPITLPIKAWATSPGRYSLLLTPFVWEWTLKR